MSITKITGDKLKLLIPGGAHTYSKGDDQWPSNAPDCLERGKGCYVWDPDGNRYLDWSMGLTSICLGHANSEINFAAVQAMELGHNFQRPSVMEAVAAERFLDFVKGRGDMVKFSKNGSSATTAAVKLARAFTSREKVGVCAQHPFFSVDDWFIGSTKCPAGIPQPIRDLTVKFSYNDIESVQRMFDENLGQISCVILEPVKFERPAGQFLQKLKNLCSKNGSLLILDEMVSGFKWGRLGAGGYYDVEADLYTWGKGMANGHSVCALTGRRDVMELGGLSHNKPRVFLASTTHGAEIPQLAAMIKTLDIFLERPQIFNDNWIRGKEIRERINPIIEKNGLKNDIELIGEDCFIAVNILQSGKHKSNVARTFLLQELVKEGQLFQGLFYPTPAHDNEALEQTYDAWEKVLPKYAEFLSSGTREKLIGNAVRPVFRAFNSCECLNPKDCEACIIKLEKLKTREI